MVMKMTGIAMSLLVLIGATSVSAGSFDESQDRQGGMKLPPQAYAACKDKNEGDSVKITTPWGETMHATCKQVDGKLAAMPEGGVREPRNSHDSR